MEERFNWRDRTGKILQLMIESTFSISFHWRYHDLFYTHTFNILLMLQKDMLFSRATCSPFILIPFPRFKNGTVFMVCLFLHSFVRDGNYREHSEALLIIGIVSNWNHLHAFTKCQTALKNRHVLYNVGFQTLKVCWMTHWLYVLLNKLNVAMGHVIRPHKELL